MKTFVTALAFTLVGSAALACLPSYTLQSTYTVSRPGFRPLSIESGGPKHETSRILIPVPSSTVRMESADPGVLKYTKTIQAEGTKGSKLLFAEFVPVATGKTVIKVTQPNGSVVNQEVIVTVLGTPRGC